MISKKSQQALEFLMTYGWAILVVLIAIGALAYFGVLKTPVWVECRENPDKCVCELQQEIVTTNINYVNHLDFELGYECCYASDDLKTIKCFKEECSKFRKKTADELLIDDCNSNPREDGACKCEIWDKPTYNYSSVTLKSGEVIKSSATGCSQEDLETSRNSGYEVNFINTTNCLKSRPKFDYEKYPEDYVAETQCIEEKCIPMADLFCDSSDNTEWEDCGDICQRQCIKNQTTYRKKTECEKLQC